MLPIQPQDFLSLTYPASLCVSPQAGYCAWLEYTPCLDSNTYAARLACRPLNGGSTAILSCVLKPSALAWEGEGSLLYSSVSEGRTRFRRVAPDSGQDLPAGDVPLTVLSFCPLSGDRLLLLVRETFRSSLWEEALILDEIPFWSNGQGYTNGRRTRLYIWDSASLTPVSPTDAEIGVVSVEGNEILYSIRPHVDKKMKFAALRRYDLASGLTQELIPPDVYDIFQARRVGDSVLVCATDMKVWGNVQNPDFFLVTAKGLVKIASPNLGVTNDITSDARYGMLNQWACDREFLYFIAATRAGSRLYRINDSGFIESLTEDDGRTIAGLSASGGSIAFVQEFPSRCGEVFLFNPLGGHVRLSQCNDAYFSTRAPIPPEHFTFISNGEELDGYVIRPANYDPLASYPGVLQIHGGPKLAYGSIFHLEMQAMAARGWFVFYCNPRGSDGRGNRFMDLRGRYGSLDYEDLMAFTSQVLERFPPLDPGRLAVCGGSYGGFMVNWIIGRTTRFCCAVSQRGISNWVSMFCTGDTGYRFVADQLDGTPWSEPRRFFTQSPVQYADKVATPTLFIHSDQDYRCPLGEGLQMFTALRYFGVEARLCLLKGENHDLSRSGRPKQRLKRLEEIFNWLDKYFHKT